MSDAMADTHSETKGGIYDIESALAGGANLSRSISVNLTHEQFERLYLQPGGTAAKGDAAKRYANPTPLGIASFLLCLTPFSFDLMNFANVTTGAAVTQSGGFYFIGGVGLMLAGLLEWIIGNTFPFVVFVTFGGFWATAGYVFQPSQGIAAAVGAGSVDFNAGFAMYLIAWAALTLIYLAASLRTNVVFVLLFGFLEITFWILIAAYLRISSGMVAGLGTLLKVGGAFAFLTTVMGWYLLVVLIFGSTGIPLQLPIGDLSNFLSGRSKSA